MEPRRDQIGTPFIGQRVRKLNFHSLSASLIEIYPLTTTRTPVVDVQTEQVLDGFMAYYRATWLPPNGQFSLTCSHSQNHSTRTTNFVEGFHSKIRAFYSIEIPSLDEMLKFCAAELIMAKTLAILLGNRLLKDGYIRPNNEVSFRADIAVSRFSPQKLPYYQCPCNLSSGVESVYVPTSSNLTEKRALILIESAYSRHGKLILQLLSAVKFPYKAEVFSKNLPLITTATKGRFSFIIIENYYKYLNMPKWNRQLLDKYCIDYQVPIISFLYSRQDDSYQKAKIKDSNLVGMERTNLNLKEWVLFENNNKYETLISARDSLGRSRVAVLRDSGEVDGVTRVLFGHNLTDWTMKMTFLDVLWFVSGGTIGWGQERYIQVDIDDIFVGARGTRMVETDVRALLVSQNHLRRHISNFTYMLGFSGSYFRNGDDIEDKGDELLVGEYLDFFH
uniref:Protein FAR1-RELATED SEQUENCE n=1 Tax=Heterorhabditis bacteriophora TaxID=37862 RepID=A0A1I7XJZ6_HETBA